MLKNSVADKLDNTYIDYAIYLLWKINIIGLVKTKATLAKEFHISPLEIDKMMMWEYELWMDALNDQIKEENDQQQQEYGKYDMTKYQKMAQNPSKMMPKMPNMNFNIPKF